MKNVTSYRRSGSMIYAYLGPTNTGKTHRAIERMIQLRGGMIGLPLRLLAREIYDRLCTVIAPERVALITGEERIISNQSKFFVCTVESMPLDKDVPIVIVDEIQLASHPIRGHVFTDRLLHARGVQETWFLGSDSMINIVKRLVPTAKITVLQRLSSLKYIPQKSLQSLPKRTAVISFNISHLYELAEYIRYTKGGVALVMGAMSPQSRNAQVELFQTGQVDYLIATDAIGMGLNLDIKNICFASLRKFDGKEQRNLSNSEIGQIAGRAGRYQRDGTFGLSKDCASRFYVSNEMIDSIERQSFFPVRKVYYRNTDLEFDSIEYFWKRLYKRPFSGCMIPMRGAMDEKAMLYLLEQKEIRNLMGNSIRLSFLWEVCRIPDYRSNSDASHFRFLQNIYIQLTKDDGNLNDSWVQKQVDKLRRDTGGIDQLMRQMAYTRTWNYIAHRQDWLQNPKEWRSKIGELEQNLSHLLHERLTQRFVDESNIARGGLPVASGVYVDEYTLWSEQMTLGWLVSFSFRSNIRADTHFGVRAR
jgi:ATP-dependent RNA helicase SUPV3L1/SUV3